KIFDSEIGKKINIDEEWMYREIEPMYFPRDKSIKELKRDKRFFMPSGNSTFYEVPKDEIEYMNQKIFIPKFKVKIIDSSEKKPPVPGIMTSTMNAILYGPPGTGKTYHSITWAVSIVEKKSFEEIEKEDRVLVKKRYNQYVAEGLILFSTFHQSLGYEDFIEGIKPIEPASEDEELSYAVEDGIFKKMCTEASFSFLGNNIKTETKKVLDFSAQYDQYVDKVNELLSKEKKVEIGTRSGGKVYIDSITDRNNIRVKHVDGAREYTVSKKRLSELAQAFPDLDEITNINNQFRGKIGGSNSSAYWAVLNAIRIDSEITSNNQPKLKSEKEYTYDDKKRIIKTLENDDYKVEDTKQYVLIIDEINRGNVSQVFGELITLIEDDKRLGNDEALNAILPYSKDRFGVPCNLHIIGTMNTADRSVEALDTALRRRFTFVNMNPEPEILGLTEDGIDLPGMLKVLNDRLRILKDNDHTIGHAWFWNVKNSEQLKIIFKNKILPLLKEYFYNDYEKLGLVLGDAFFMPHKQVNSGTFAPFSGGNGLAGQYDQTWQYVLKPVDELTIDDFKTLVENDSQSVSDEE
ncbi:MAG TPA: AAA family ATPase, partial [Bacteroidales bacterium]|nr:AAA family ATPase [Bacteroidales bacterium]